MRVVAGCIVFLAFVIAGNGDCSVVPSEMTKTVVFIYRDAAGTPPQAQGTGFIVSIPTAADPNRSWSYLVTAQNVVHTNKDDLSSPLFTELWVRVNNMSGGSAMYKLNIIPSGPNQTVFFHSDPSVDLAVLSISPTDADKLDIKTLPEEMLTSADDFKKLNIGVGTDMFFTGMFTGFLGEKKSYPIVRFGKLAMMPDEKIRFLGSPAEGYLMEAFSFGGNSGSPVFFYPSSDNTPGIIKLGSPTIKIAGVMRGFFGDAELILFAQNPSAANGPPIPFSKGNTGIAFVVPAHFISEILHSETLEGRRQNNQSR